MYRIKKVKEKRKHQVIFITCSYCGKYKRANSVGQKYCSQCRDTAYKEVSCKGKEERSKKGYTPKTHITCVTCLKYVKKTGANQRRCEYCRNISKYRKLAFENKPHRCNRCSKPETPQTANVHHLDRCRGNNSLSNLEIMCTGCHRDDHILRDEFGRIRDNI